MHLTDIPIERIDWPAEHNGRLDTDEATVAALAQQIATCGLLHPITVRPRGERFEGIAGRNRTLAYQTLNRTHIPAQVLEVTDHTAALTRLAENVARSKLSPVEEARQLHALLDNEPAGVERLATQLGRNVEWILNRLDLLDYDPDLQLAVHRRTISLAAANILARIPDPNDRQRLIHQAATHGISAATARLWLQHALAQTPDPPKNDIFSGRTEPSAYIAETKALCFACRNYEAIESTQPVRICNTCHEQILDAQRRQPTHNQPELSTLRQN